MSGLSIVPPRPLQMAMDHFSRVEDQVSGAVGIPLERWRWISEIVIGASGCDSCGTSSVKMIVARTSKGRGLREDTFQTLSR